LSIKKAKKNNAEKALFSRVLRNKAKKNKKNKEKIDFFPKCNTIVLMKKGDPISVRLPLEIIQRLDNATKKLGLGNRASLIKMSTSSFLDYLDQTGIAGLPLNWKEIIHKLDGRSQRYKNFNIIANQSVVGGNMINHNLAVAEKRAPHHGAGKKGGKK